MRVFTILLFLFLAPGLGFADDSTISRKLIHKNKLIHKRRINSAPPEVPSKDTVTAKLNEESKKLIESAPIPTQKSEPSSNTKITTVPAKSSENTVVPIKIQKPNVTDDDLHYNLPVEIYQSLTTADKNRLQSGCWMFDEYKRSECKGKRYNEVLKPAKELCKNKDDCINDRLEVVDYCAKHPSAGCEAEQSVFVEKARTACSTYDCRIKKLEELRVSSLMQKTQNTTVVPSCPQCEASKNH